MSYRKHSVAVVSPHFNRVASLRNALQSIAYQTRKPEEVIIVDDGSVPENLEEIYRIVREFSNELEVKLIKNRSEEHTSELQSLMRISYAVFCLKKKKKQQTNKHKNEKHRKINNTSLNHHNNKESYLIITPTTTNT